MGSSEFPLPRALPDIPLAGKLLVRMLRGIECGSLTLVDPDRTVLAFGQAGAMPQAELRLRDWRAAGEILRRGDVGFAHSLRQGWLECPDMLALFCLALSNEAQARQALSGRWWALLVDRLRHVFLRDNSRWGSRRNILAHYDLGNDFYGLWLDNGMTYSSALFEGDLTRSLEDAQDAKYARIIGQLDARPGDSVLEVGCGWGGFAQAAAERGLKVTGITLSREQLAFAQARMARHGLTDRVSLHLMDYRDLGEQRFDHIVSVEMIEAVGQRRWPLYFSTLARCLKPGGRVVIQSIDIEDARFDAYSRTTDFIQQHVFPGGMLPSPSRIISHAQHVGLKPVDCLDFGMDYAHTLERWRAAFEANLPAVMRMGFDDAFVRIWRMYLCYCEAGFRLGRTSVKHWTLE